MAVVAMGFVVAVVLVLAALALPGDDGGAGVADVVVAVQLHQ